MSHNVAALVSFFGKLFISATNILMARLYVAFVIIVVLLLLLIAPFPFALLAGIGLVAFAPPSVRGNSTGRGHGGLPTQVGEATTNPPGENDDQTLSYIVHT